MTQENLTTMLITLNLGVEILLIIQYAALFSVMSNEFFYSRKNSKYKVNGLRVPLMFVVAALSLLMVYNMIETSSFLINSIIGFGWYIFLFGFAIKLFNLVSNMMLYLTLKQEYVESHKVDKNDNTN